MRIDTGVESLSLKLLLRCLLVFSIHLGTKNIGDFPSLQHYYCFLFLVEKV